MYREDKTFAILFTLCLSLLSAPLMGQGAGSAVASEPLHLSVDDVIERVKGQNLQLLMTQESVRRALEQSYQRRAALLPQFSLNAQQSRQQTAYASSSTSLDIPPYNLFTSRIEASLPIFDTQRYADFKIAQLNYAIEQMNYEVATQDLLHQAIFLYFTQLRDLRRVEIARENVEREQALLDLTQQQYDAGSAVKIDVTRSEVRLATERRTLMEAEIAVEDSMLQLKSLLDLDLERAVGLDRGIIMGAKAPPSIKRYGSLEVLTELRPELEKQQKVLTQAELAKKAAGWQRLPTLELFANWGYDSNHAFDGDEAEAWLLGVRASIPLWEGGRIAAESREASAAVRQNQYQLRQLRNQIEREFKFSILEMDSLYAQIEIARDEVRLGHDEVQQASERYREGLGDNRELIDAQIRLADAERSHLNAFYLYGLSRLTFARSIGSVERVLD
ncbi:TolC family protein [Coraliomargarita sp. SDUM461004]|uniref:TolC family protein n=1 Tax=Thalassobacterium sedimentorum TaxID=3041258 RepID=A0ABU1AMF3_9BACT|nr:TolC family protein [Coraliomargarita sp. SDUM461004]MDQ8195987.1 TolC family protein [Coraliomargarita sp. SDUM461004]